jgi:hypothetical protein
VPAGSEPIEGAYRWPVQLISGKFAVIEDARHFELVSLAAGAGPRIGQERARLCNLLDARLLARAVDHMTFARKRV